MPASADSQPGRDFLSLVAALDMLPPGDVEQLRAEAATAQTLPSQLALQKGLLSPAQIDIVETLSRPTETIPGYEILGVLGQGGMGVVFRARQVNLNRIVALKTILINRMADSAAAERFKQEAQAVARLAHPHIIAAYDFGQQDGRLFFAMELVEGEDLHKLIERRGPLDERTAWGLVRQAAAGLAHAAQHGMVHRDIKPANLLLVDPPAGFPLPVGMPLLKIADFGLARWAADESTRLTSVGMTVGSPLYMSPEQLRGQAVDQRTDIFALGASAFHMLAGRPQLSGLDLSQIVANRFSGQAESLATLRPQLTRGSIELVEEMMAADPERRLADYGQLCRRIDALWQSRDTLGQLATVEFSPSGVANNVSLHDAPTHIIPASRWRFSSNRLAIVAAALALALVAWGILGRPNAPGTRNLVPAGKLEYLFNGHNINTWQTVSGGWNPAKNNEGAVVLQGQREKGRAEIRRLLLDPAADAPRPLVFFRLSFVVDLHEASAVDLLFDFRGSPPRGPRKVLRIDRRQIAVGDLRASDAEPAWNMSREHGPNATGTTYAIQLEHHRDSWWIFVDELLLAGVVADPIEPDAPPPTATFGLRAEGGPAWFSDFTADELLPQ